MKPLELAKGIYWIGAIDWDLRYFHGYITQRGSSYNAYLIVDDKIAIIDTVKAPFASQMMERITEIIDPEKIDYLISLHVEMDHSGSIPYILEKCPNAQLVTSAPAGLKGLIQHFGPLEAQTVKTGDTLSLGQRSLQFVQTPMLHWPDNTMAFMPEEHILFSSDAFGQHFSSTARFDDEVDYSNLFFEAGKYYANIVLPFGSQTLKALDVASGLDIRMIAPSHGLIWRKNIPDIIQKYQQWAKQETKNQGVVIYDTMWESSKKMALAIMNGMVNAGIPAKMLNLQQNHISDIMIDLLEAKYIAIGSPTINNNMLPTAAGFLCYMKGLGVKNRIGIPFGSYGWSGQSIGQIADVMKELKWEIPLEPIRQVYIPQEENLQALTKQITEMVKNTL
ncbi:MAG: FprA family A-type flavoprotein [Clostridiales bacterium]